MLRPYKIIAVLAFLLFNAQTSWGIDDGLSLAKKIEGKHFTIYYTPPPETNALIQQLNIQLSDRLLAGKPVNKIGSSEADFADMIDTLFIRVCDILDMNLYSFQGAIKICQDYNQLNQVYKNLFDKDLGNMPSFYVYDLNTIYITSDNFKREVLGHEIAHAVISHYFVVLPSVKIQEVLAMYVEYQLRKTEQ